MPDRFKAVLHSIDSDGWTAWVRLEPLVQKENIIFPETAPRFTIALNRLGFDSNAQPVVHKDVIYTIGYIKQGKGLIGKPDGNGYLIKLGLSEQVYSSDTIEGAHLTTAKEAANLPARLSASARSANGNLKIPVVCSCGAISKFEMPGMEDAGQMAVMGNVVSCPRCGGDARMVDTIADRSSDGPTRLRMRGINQEQLNVYEMLVQRDLERLRVHYPAEFKIVQGLAQKADAGAITEAQAANEIAKFLPRESAAAVKKLGSKRTLQAITLWVGLAGAVATTGKAISDWIAPSTPAQTVVAAPAAPPLTINNNNTIINQSAPQNTGSIAPPPVVKREQARRIKQVERQRQKRGQEARKPEPEGYPYRKPEEGS